MYRFFAFGLASAFTMFAGTGCLFNKNNTNKGDSSVSSLLNRETKPGLLVGPQGNNGNPPQELPPSEAAAACLQAAHEMDKAGQIEEAIRLYEKARQDNPSLTVAISRRLAVLYDKFDQFHKSKLEYDIALKAAPNDVELICDIGYSYYCRSDWMNAEKYLRQATQLQSQHKRSWMNLGLTLGAKGNFQGAYEAFMMAVTPAEAHCNLAFCMAVEGMTEEAKGEYRKAISLDPSCKLARAGLENLEHPRPVPPPKPASMAGFKRADASSVSNIVDIMERLRREEEAGLTKAPVIPASNTER